MTESANSENIEPKVLITGDTHGEIELTRRLSRKKFPEGRNLTKDDLIIIAGDFGLIWDNNPYNRVEKYLTQWLNERKWTTLFVDGNHENHWRLNMFPVEERWGGKVGVISDSIFHLKRGEIFNFYGKSFFCFGGALSYDKPGRKLGLSYWEEEIPSHAEMEYALQNLEKHQYCVDYIISHTIPETIMKTCGWSKGDNDPTRKFLDHIIREVKFHRMFCGHMHVDKDMWPIRLIYHDIVQVI